ncbi:MAG: outer membrane beta-barrel protein [Vicinamibacterales bacterium]
MQKHLLLSISLCAAVVLAAAAPSAAQSVPEQGHVALGADIGLFAPTDDQFDNGLLADGFIEYYFTDRLSLRGGLAATSPAFVRGTDDSLRQFRLAADGIYNWEMGRIHPFAGGGLGLHLLQVKQNGEPIGESSTKLGISILGGIEYFLDTQWTLKAEGRFQWVDDPALVNPDGLALTVGVKRYF